MPGDHPFIRHKTYVNYSEARHVAIPQLEALRAKRLVTPKPRVTAALLRRIRIGAVASVRMPLAYRQTLIDQGLVEE
jgi:hypothetical protein